MFSPGAWSSQHGAEQDCADGIWLEVESSWSSWCENYLVTSSASVFFKENEAVLGSKREGLSTALSVLGGCGGGAGSLVVGNMQCLTWFSLLSLPLPA